MGWAIIAAVTLLLSVVGAQLTELIEIAGVGELFGISRWITIPITVIALIAMGFVGSYHRFEHIGEIVGLFELTFIIALVMVHPNLSEMVPKMGSIPFHNSSYIYLVAANVGAVIMPWMIFYQQGAVIDKKLKPKMIHKEQLDTAIGTVITQGIMIGFIILFAATVGKTNSHAILNTVSQLATSLSPFIGSTSAKLMMGLSILGGSLVAALVIAVSGTWGMTEVLNWHHSLNEPLNRNSLGFYSLYALIFIAAAMMVLMNVNLVSLAIGIEVMNTWLLPIALGFLIILEAGALPDRYRMHGWYRWLTTGSCLIVILFGFYMLDSTLNWW
ncbi:hypothetical protein WR164_02130 [Philodulcilactobacillus myokoensis]|uniref:Divalent metal cation transporter n=1 Tax=Philodulcilactobacillus myokoensis TaxID=2929573 RepID=A0A9W6AZ46_9LACO|nr:hypothetical protein WR164_02130 [Philodulcilactobacillus myokoensis]